MSQLKILIIFLLLSFTINGITQRGSAKFGLQYKPIIPNTLIGFYEQEFNKNQFESTVKQRLGHSYGMIIRVGLSDAISLESGINYAQRKFNLNYSVPDSGYAEQGSVKIVSYEIPLTGLVFIRLSDQFYMSTSLGASMTLFPSDVRTYEPIDANERFQQEGAYRSKLQGAMNANIGFELRTKSKGTFYLGSSYHLPFTPIMTFAMSYEHNNSNEVAIDNIRGSYLTVDLRYFFNEKKDKK